MIPEPDQSIITNFAAFLSWHVPPAPHRDGLPPVPPAWYAYAWGLTGHCPPVGVL